MEYIVLSAYIQILHHFIHKLYVITTLQKHKWCWTLRLSLCYCFIGPALKKLVFTDGYHNPAYKLLSIPTTNFPVLCNVLHIMLIKILNITLIATKHLPHSKQFITGTYSEFWTFSYNFSCTWAQICAHRISIFYRGTG